MRPAASERSTPSSPSTIDSATRPWVEIRASSAGSNETPESTSACNSATVSDFLYVDEFEIYPAVAERLGGDDPLASMSRTHREIFHLANLFARLADDLTDAKPTTANTVEARRLFYALYALDAVLRLHFAEEEELFAALRPGVRRPLCLKPSGLDAAKAALSAWRPERLSGGTNQRR
jgi:hypothetical protein